MARRTFTIEMKADLDDNDPRYEPLKQIVQLSARELLAQVMLLASDKKPPQVVAFTEDAFFTTEEIHLNAPEEGTSEAPAEAEAEQG